MGRRIAHDHGHASEGILDFEAEPPAPIDLGGSVQTIYSATVTLTNEDIKALPVTPFEIVAAPGERQGSVLHRRVHGHAS